MKRRSCIEFSLCMAVSRLPGRRCTAHQSLELPLHLTNTDPCRPRRPPGPAGSQCRSPLSCCLACPVVPFCPPSTDTGTSLISRLSPTGVCHRRLLNSLTSSASVCRQPRRRHQLLSGSSIDSGTQPVPHYYEAIEQGSFHQAPFSSTQRPLSFPNTHLFASLSLHTVASDHTILTAVSWLNTAGTPYFLASSSQPGTTSSTRSCRNHRAPTTY